MLKTLKWIYDLGYKHAETKYYHALMQQIESPTEDDWLRYEFGETDSAKRKDEINNRLRRNDDFRSIVNSVFHPVEYEDHPLKEIRRFEP